MFFFKHCSTITGVYWVLWVLSPQPPVTSLALHATCSISEPPPTCTLFAAFWRNILLPTFYVHTTYVLHIFYLHLVYLIYIYICIYLYATCEYVLPIYYSYDHIAA